VALLTPGDNFPSVPLFPQKDKAVHFLIFGVLTFLWSRVWTLDKNRKLKKLNFFTNYLVFGVFFATLLEYLQKYVPNRSFDLWDIAANIIGGTFGIICFYILYKRDSKLV
jgi:VanZ family protein